MQRSCRRPPRGGPMFDDRATARSCASGARPAKPMAIVDNVADEPGGAQPAQSSAEPAAEHSRSTSAMWCGRGDYGGRDRVRRLFREMILAGHCAADPERHPDGTFGAASIWSCGRGAVARACGYLRRVENAEDGQIAEGNTASPATAQPSLGIDNSIVNPDTDTGRGKAERPVAPATASGRPRSRPEGPSDR